MRITNQAPLTLKKFADVREIQKDLKAKRLALATEADESNTGLAILMLFDRSRSRLPAAPLAKAFGVDNEGGSTALRT
jgi:hypothetical protein